MRSVSSKSFACNTRHYPRSRQILCPPIDRAHPHPRPRSPLCSSLCSSKPSATPNRHHRINIQLQNSFGTSLAVACLILGCLTLYNFNSGEPIPEVNEVPVTADRASHLIQPNFPDFPDFDAMPVQQGYRGNLTAEQETKLRELWTVTLRVFGVEDHHKPDGVAETPDTASEADVSLNNHEKTKKKRMSIFRKKDKNRDSLDSLAEGSADDKYGQVKEFHDILESTSAESLRKAFWDMVKADHPDALLLRFLRARKWNVDKALVMLIATMKWRAVEMHVDDDVMMHGEGGALEDSRSSNSATKKEGEDFLAQLRLGKSFLHGVDKEGRPLCVVRVRLHRQGEQSERSLERYTVYVIETARLVLRSPVETAVSSSLKTEY